jgi:hypothetical protein
MTKKVSQNNKSIRSEKKKEITIADLKATVKNISLIVKDFKSQKHHVDENENKIKLDSTLRFYYNDEQICCALNALNIPKVNQIILISYDKYEDGEVEYYFIDEEIKLNRHLEKILDEENELRSAYPFRVESVLAVYPDEMGWSMRIMGNIGIDVEYIINVVPYLNK